MLTSDALRLYTDRMAVGFEDFPELINARNLWNQSLVAKANQAFQLACDLRPKNVRARVEFARALGQQHRIELAEQLLDQAEAIANGDPRTLIVVAQSFRSIYRQPRAKRIFESLRSFDQLPPPILGELAVLYEQFGEFDAALETIEACVGFAPHRPEPKLIQARILRHLKRYDQAEHVLVELAAFRNASPTLRIETSTELCHLFDATGRYAEAMAAIEAAKALTRGTEKAQRLRRQSAALNKRFSRLYADLDARTVRRWLDADIRLEENLSGVAHILGFPRTGTTLLEQALDSHPQIACAPERVVFSKHIHPALVQREPSFSLRTLDRHQPGDLMSLAGRYLRLHEEILGQPLGERWLVDKNPNHTSLLAGILRVLPASRFIVVERDPRDVLISCFMRTFPLSEYSVAFLDLQSTWELYQHEQRILERMQELLPERFTTVRYEDMVESLAAEAHRVVEFLGIDPTEELLGHLATTQSKIVNSPTHAEVRGRVTKARVGRWKNYRESLRCIEGLDC